MLPVSVRENGILCLAVKGQALFLVYDVDYYTRGEGRLGYNGKKNYIYSVQSTVDRVFFFIRVVTVLPCLPK